MGTSVPVGRPHTFHPIDSPSSVNAPTSTPVIRDAGGASVDCLLSGDPLLCEVAPATIPSSLRTAESSCGDYVSGRGDSASEEEGLNRDEEVGE